MTPKEVRQKWVEMLRSGKYEQGKNRLRGIDNKYCCLGVLCELAVQEKVINPPVLMGQEYAYDDDTVELTHRIKDWSGIRSHSGAYEDGNLARDNDAGMLFKDIANTIEAEPEGLVQ